MEACWYREGVKAEREYKKAFQYRQGVKAWHWREYMLILCEQERSKDWQGVERRFLSTDRK